MFEDRTEAGQRLAGKLGKYRDSDAVVLALPRGGVVIGYEIAHALELPLDIVVTRKIGHPNDPEYALCAVDAKGTLLCDDDDRALVNEAWFAQEVARERTEAERRLKLYRGEREALSLVGKTAIIVDDGVATGLTMRLAIKAVRALRPERVVVAVPVAPAEVVAMLTHEADELITLLSPAEFAGAVGAHYRVFGQVDDDTVVKLLQR